MPWKLVLLLRPSPVANVGLDMVVGMSVEKRGLCLWTHQQEEQCKV